MFQHIPCSGLLTEELFQHLSVTKAFNVKVSACTLVIKITICQLVGNVLLECGFIKNVAHIKTFLYFSVSLWSLKTAGSIAKVYINYADILRCYGLNPLTSIFPVTASVMRACLYS